MCFARVRPVAIGLMTGGTLLTATAGFAASVLAAPQSLAATVGSLGGIGGTVTNSPVVWQGQQVQLPTTTPPPSSTPPPPPPTSPTETPATPTPSQAPSSAAPTTSASTTSAPATTPASSATEATLPPSSPASSTQTPATPTSSAATLTAFHARAATTPQPSLCVSVQRTQDKVVRGATATWQIAAWAQNGNVSDVVINVAATPTTQKAVFSFGCGSGDGTAACNLGTVFSGSTQRQVLAKITVPASDTAVMSVKLTASLSATGLVKTPAAAAAVSVTKPPASSTPSTSTSSSASTRSGGTGTGGTGGTGT